MSSSAGHRERDRVIFEGFLAAAPAFSATISGDWTQPLDDPPDVRFTDASARRVGVELKAWLNQKQMEEGKRLEAIKARWRSALHPQPTNTFQIVSHVWLRPRGNRTPSGTEAAAFKAELLSLVVEQDDAWIARGHEIVAGETLKRFQERPTLAGYLSAVMVFPRTVNDRTRQDWIGFPFRGGPYSEDDMLDPLVDLIADARDKYETTKTDKALDRLVLLIHYDGRARQYNSPIETPHWDLSVFADEGAFMAFALDTLSDDSPPLDEIYLFDAVDGRAILLHPR